MEDFYVKVIYGWGMRWLILKGGEPIGGSNSRVGMASPPHIDTMGIKVSIMSG